MAALLATTGDAVVRISQDGDAWSSVRLLESVGAMSVAVDPRDPERIFAGSTERGLWRSLDGGESFDSARLPEDGVFSVAVGPLDGAVYAGCEPSALFRSRDGGVRWEELSALREIPSAPTWS